jgi:hypothetical protein
MLTIKVIHEHHHHVHSTEGELLLSIAASFEAQVTRLEAFVNTLKGGAAGQSDEDTAELTAKLDALGAPPAVPPDGQPA